MNYCAISGFLGKDPEVRYNDSGLCIARYSLAVRRRFVKDGEQDTDWLNIVAFGKSGEFAERYLRKGSKIIVEGRIQTGSYEKDGVKHYTTDIIVEHQEFADSKNSGNNNASESAPAASEPQQTTMDDWMQVPEGSELEAELPFA